MYLTKADQKVLKFIKKYFKEFGQPPTHVAIANEFSKSRQWATYRVDRLRKLNKIIPTKRFGVYVIHFD